MDTSYKKFLRIGWKGQGSAEYGIMITVIGISLIFIMTIFENTLKNSFSNVVVCGDVLSGDTNASCDYTYDTQSNNSVTNNQSNANNQSSSNNQQPPVAQIDVTCNGLSCSFSALNSTPISSIASYAWNFGDNAITSSSTKTHSYGNPGTFTVTLTVTDKIGQTNKASKSLTVTDNLWIDNVDAPLANGTNGSGNKWTLNTITFHVRNSTGANVSGAPITMSDGKTCVTNGSGICNISGYSILLNSATATTTVTISGISANGFTYLSANNTNTDGDGNAIAGNAVTITNPK